jgi:AcrR family transcriptional regulator
MVQPFNMVTLPMSMQFRMEDKNLKLGQEDWLVAALNVLSEEGIEKVKVEPLAVYLGVTKGSFYWHFKNREALLTQMVDYWVAVQNEIIDRLGESALEPKQRLWNLLQFVGRKDSQHDVAIRAWALNNSYAAKAVMRIDARRLIFCEKLFEQMGFAGNECKLRARMVYFYQVGEYTVINRDAVKLRLTLAELRYNMLITQT